MDIALARDRLTIRVRDVSLFWSRAMCRHRPTCFVFDPELIDTLYQSAEELRAALELSFPDASDFEAATSLIVSTLVDSAVAGARESSALKAAALATLQEAYPRIAINEAVSSSIH